jgi:hypothetical protein
MSKAQQLEVLSNDIKVRGCAFTPTALVLDVVNEETLLHAGVFLAQVEGCRSWWWGDYLLAYCGFRLETEGDSLRDEAKRDPAMRQKLFRRYTAEREDVAHVDVKTLNEWRDTADFYKVARRRAELSNQHHVEAMQGADGDEAIADEWLDKAVANHWTRPQLRAAIRRSKQSLSEPDEPMPQFMQQELFACARWARTTSKRVDDMQTNEAQQLLVSLQPILDLATRLAAKIAATPSEGKESITAAA